MSSRLLEISIHALLAESDLYINRTAITIMHFLSTLSLRRATHKTHRSASSLPSFLSTLSLRRATGACARRLVLSWISIHALLAESDSSLWFLWCRFCNFYPRSPCGERPDTLTDDVSTGGFLSTLSLRRATRAPNRRSCPHSNFYPRSPCGERL